MCLCLFRLIAVWVQRLPRPKSQVLPSAQTGGAHYLHKFWVVFQAAVIIRNETIKEISNRVLLIKKYKFHILN